MIPREFKDYVTEKWNHLQVTRLSLRRSPPFLVVDGIGIPSAVTVWPVLGRPSQELPSSTLQALICKPKYPNKSGHLYHGIENYFFLQFPDWESCFRWSLIRCLPMVFWRKTMCEQCLLSTIVSKHIWKSPPFLATRHNSLNSLKPPKC